RLAWTTSETADPRTRSAARRFALALDWIPAHLMVLAMALVSNFDAVNELADARRLMQRVLIVWLAVVALIVLAGWVA
ncbi:MAG: hypothetical protein ACREPJ_02755, partial [Rhodanobacteraceae bacterium]